MLADDGAHGLTGLTWLHDDFTDDALTGQVIDSLAVDGRRRVGIDAEGVLSIDHRALRLAPLLAPGWGRVAVGHGPVAPQPGWGAALLVLAGHNAADTLPIGPFMRRVARWVMGNEVDPLPIRLLRWPGAPRRESPWRRLRRWRHRQALTGATPDESLAVGLFSTSDRGPSPGDQVFVVRTAGPANGELTVRVQGHDLPVVASLQNLPMLYVALVTETGTLYGLSSLAGAQESGEYPAMRPLAIDPAPPPERAYVALHQRVVSQEGFSNDTRLYALRSSAVEQAVDWWSTAVVADHLLGEGPLTGRVAARGGRWTVAGDLRTDGDGAHGEGTAMLDAPADIGLVALRIGLDPDARAGVVWRDPDGGATTSVLVGWIGGLLTVEVGGEVCEHETRSTLPEGNVTMQLRAAEGGVAVVVDGRQVVQRADIHLPDAGGRIGLRVHPGATVHHFEAHPLAVPVPEGLRVVPPSPGTGVEVVVDEQFAATAPDLDGHVGAGGVTWERTSGTGRFELAPERGACAVATADAPMAGRTAYTVAWDRPGGADLAATICPPGSGRGEGHASRAGLIFVQDDRNHLIVNTWLADGYGGASISVFLRLGGFEDIYDAVWTNVGDRLTWGRPFELRVAFDGRCFVASVDGEPVIYRAISDLYPTVDALSVRRVGIVTNWEWGLDTGSCFRRFTARAMPTDA